MTVEIASPVRESHRRPKVLYIDYSVGFGGAIKSLALTLQGTAETAELVVTAQDPELVHTWLGGMRVHPFRRVMNYRTLGRIRDAVRRRLPVRWVHGPILKMIAAADFGMTLKNCLWLVWLLRRHRIDLIHLNNGFGPLEALWAARMTGTPCVVHQRDFPGGGQRLHTDALRQVSHVIAVSDAVAAEVRRRGFAGCISTIYDPVDWESLQRGAAARAAIRARCEIGEADVAVGIFGRVIPWKGQEEFVLAALRAMHDDPRLRAVIVGDPSDGDPAYFKRIRARIEQSAFASRFFLAGYQERVEEYYAAMDIVVHASITPEPFGMVVPEAMAAGRAVIAMDAGGPREVITRGVDGLLVPPGDVAMLGRVLAELAGDPVRRRRLGMAARETARERFQIETNAGMVRAVHESVLGAGTPPPTARRHPLAGVS